MAGVFGQSLYACSGGRVAGKHLQPFSAHHAMMLLEIESPYVCGGAVNIADTTQALVVCMSTRKTGMGMLMRFNSNAIVRLVWRFWWVFRSHSKVSMELQNWITSSVRFPDMWTDPEAQGKSTGAPWPYYIVSLIAQEMPSIPYADLWDMPLCEIGCHKAIIDERSGGAEIATKDLEMLRRMKDGDANG
jgi:hypothetical protein